jgi:tetratricopeptide (TPR) repeat protein
MAGVFACLETPREVSRWHLAIASRHFEAGRRAEAQRSLAKAQSWDPDSLLLVLKQAQLHKASGEYEAALKEIDRALADLPDNVLLLEQRAELLQHLGRHDQAVEIWKSLNRVSQASGQPPREEALNGLAYAQAIANQEVEAGLESIERALQLSPGNSAMLDTRGFLLYRQEKYEAALRDIDAAVHGYQRMLDLAEEKLPLEQRVMLYSELREPPLEFAKRNAAVIHYHRSLVLDKLGRYAEAKLERARVKRLIGREADETLF